MNGEDGEAIPYAEEIERHKKGLAKCLVCGSEAEIVVFGFEGNGVWVGCCKTDDCSRFIEYHKSGYSISDAVKDWNRLNSGIFGKIRRLKMWFRNNFGVVAAEKKRIKRAESEKKRAKERKMEEIFGIK